jgi:hypothetical protein
MAKAGDLGNMRALAHEEREMEAILPNTVFSFFLKSTGWQMLACADLRRLRS